MSLDCPQCTTVYKLRPFGMFSCNHECSGRRFGLQLHLTVTRMPDGCLGFICGQDCRQRHGYTRRILSPSSMSASNPRPPRANPVSYVGSPTPNKPARFSWNTKRTVYVYFPLLFPIYWSVVRTRLWMFQNYRYQALAHHYNLCVWHRILFGSQVRFTSIERILGWVCLVDGRALAEFLNIL